MKPLGLAAMILGAAVACGGNREQPSSSGQPAAAPAQPNQTPPPAQPATLAPAPAPNVGAVDFERLRALLPELPGWTRGRTRGENVSAGFETSKVEAQYQKEESVIDLEIIDSALSPVVLMPRTMFMGRGYSERSPQGYRKAVTVRGLPGFESWDEDLRRAEIVVVVANRHIVQATGYTVDSVDVLRPLVMSIDLASLAAIK